MKQYQILSDFNDDGIVFKKGEVYWGNIKNKEIVTLTKNGKPIDVVLFSLPGVPLVKELPIMATGFKVKKWLTSLDVSGKAAVTKANSASVYGFNPKGEFILLFKLATKGANLGIASGRAVEMTNGYTYYLVTLKNAYNGVKYGYVTYQDFYFSAIRVEDEAKAKKDAQVLLNTLVELDKKNYTKILAFQILLEKAKAKGIDVKAQQAQLTEIAIKWTVRQTSIKANPYIQITSIFKLHGINGIGIVPIIAGVAIGAGIVIAGFVVYYFLKPELDVSKLHSDYLDKNEAELKAKLGPQKYEELKQNVNKEIQDNAQKAYQEGKSEGTKKLLKPILWGVLGFLLIKKVQEGGTRTAKA